MTAVRVNVGLDYGTSTTKIVVRRRGADDAPRVVRVATGAEGGAPFLCPSVVRECDGRLWFGDEALHREGGTLLRSLKAELLPPSMESVRPASAPTLAGTEIDIVVATYLGWVLAGVRQALDDEYGAGGYRLTLNVGAPMNHADADLLKTRFLRVVAAAWETAFGADPIAIPQGTNIARVRPVIARWLEAAIPGRDVRPYEVLPEAVAPIVAMKNDPEADPGMFLVVDIGGTTTEAAVVHMGRRLQLTAYSAGSERIGGDDLDRIEEDRRAGAADLAEHFLERARGRVRSVVLSSWEHGYRKEARNAALAPAWKATRALLIGGGGFRDAFRRVVETNSPWNTRYPGDPARYGVSWYAPQPIRRVVAAEYAGSEQMAPLLVIADGLSYHRQEWPTWTPPRDVGAFPEPAAQEDSDPSWYQDRL